MVAPPVSCVLIASRSEHTPDLMVGPFDQAVVGIQVCAPLIGIPVLGVQVLFAILRAFATPLNEFGFTRIDIEIIG